MIKSTLSILINIKKQIASVYKYNCIEVFEILMYWIYNIDEIKMNTALEKQNILY
jgi:hypothetical protein